MRKILYIMCFILIGSTVCRSQSFESSFNIKGNTYPCASFLYKFSAEILTTTLSNYAKEHQIQTSKNKDLYGDEYIIVPCRYINNLLSQYDFVIKIDSMEGDKSILSITSFIEGTTSFNSSMFYNSIKSEILNNFNIINDKCIETIRDKSLSEKLQTIITLRNEIQILSNEMNRVKDEENASINREVYLQQQIRQKKILLQKEEIIYNELLLSAQSY